MVHSIFRKKGVFRGALYIIVFNPELIEIYMDVYHERLLKE